MGEIASSRGGEGDTDSFFALRYKIYH